MPIISAAALPDLPGGGQQRAWAAPCAISFAAAARDVQKAWVQRCNFTMSPERSLGGGVGLFFFFFFGPNGAARPHTSRCSHGLIHPSGRRVEVAAAFLPPPGRSCPPDHPGMGPEAALI